MSDLGRKAQILFIFVALSGCQTMGPGLQTSSKVCFSDYCYNVETVSTPAERAQGLMGRTYLPVDRGMLFVFSVPGREAFWMKNMQFAIDIIWMDEMRRVVHIERDVPPCVADRCPVYRTTADSKYILEVNAGGAEKQNIKVGQSVNFQGVI